MGAPAQNDVAARLVALHVIASTVVALKMDFNVFMSPVHCKLVQSVNADPQRAHNVASRVPGSTRARVERQSPPKGAVLCRDAPNHHLRSRSRVGSTSLAIYTSCLRFPYILTTDTTI